ncbi:MAG: hypothetical protein ACLR76_01910 [Alistipes sp.]
MRSGWPGCGRYRDQGRRAPGGRLGKDSLSGAVSHDPENHERMVGLRAAKVAACRTLSPSRKSWEGAGASC